MEPSNDCRRVHDGIGTSSIFSGGINDVPDSIVVRHVSHGLSFLDSLLQPQRFNFAGRDLEAFRAACVSSQCRQRLGKLSRLVARTYLAECLIGKHMQRVTIGRKDGYLLWTYKPANDDDTRLAFELRKQLRSSVDAVLPGL